MKIALEGSTLFTKGYTGIPFYIDQLFKSLSVNNDADIRLTFNLKRYLKRKKARKSLLKNPCSWYFGSTLFSSDFTPDISHTLHSPFLNIRKTKKVATIHDLAVNLPEFRDENFASDYFINKRFELMKQIANNSDAIISVSENTKRDFLRFFDFPEEKIHVVHLAPVYRKPIVSEEEETQILKNYNLTDQQFFLSVGGVSHRKNTINLVKGYINSDQFGIVKLVIAGKVSESEMVELEELLENNKAKGSVVITGYLNDSSIDILYQNTCGFLFPTRYEGFGIPILEAMNKRIPVLTSNVGAAPEIANGYCVLVDPLDIESISQGINILKDVSEDQVTRAYEYSCQFSWDKVAMETIAVYQSVLGD